jgi:hypothetical protein
VLALSVVTPALVSCPNLPPFLPLPLNPGHPVLFALAFDVVNHSAAFARLK